MPGYNGFLDRSYFIDRALNKNPQLQGSPGLTSDVANAKDPEIAAVGIQHSANTIATNQAINDHITENASGGFWSKVGHGALKSLEMLGAPMREIQRDYKFQHSVYVKHGIFEGLIATAGVIGAGILGGRVGGSNGAILAADAAASLERQLGRFTIAEDSYKDSEDPNYQVSFGRDLSNLIGLHNTDEGMGKVVSGTGDLIFDVAVDPVRIGLSAKPMIKGGKFLKVEGKTVSKIPLAARYPAVLNFLERNSLRMFTPDQVDLVYKVGTKEIAPTIADRLVGTGRNYVKALDDLAGLSAGDIVAKYPTLAGLADEIGVATTRQAVHNIFLRTMTEADLMSRFSNGAAFLPSRTVARAAASKVSDALRQMTPEDEAATAATSIYSRANQTNFFVPRRGFKPEDASKAPWILPVAFRPLSKEAWASAIAGKVRTFSGYVPFTIDSGTLNLSTKTFRPDDPNSLTGIYRVFRFSLGDRAARDMVSAYASATDDGARKAIYLAGLHEMLKAAGLPDDARMVTQLVDEMAIKFGDTIGGQTFGHGLTLGDDVSTAVTANGSVRQALWDHQRGMFSYPDFREVKKAMRSMGAVGKLYGEVDDFAAKYYTDSFFKPFALLTAGFGLRIAASEMLPMMFRYGVVQSAKAKISAVAAKMKYKLAAGEDEHILANAAAAVSGGGSLADFLAQKADSIAGKPIRKTIAETLSKTSSEEDLELASAIAMATRGHMVIGASLTGHGTDLDAMERAKNIVSLFSQSRGRLIKRESNNFVPLNTSDPTFTLQYTTQLQKASQNQAQRIITDDLRMAVESGMTAEEAILAVTRKETARIKNAIAKPDGLFGDASKDIYASSRGVLAGFTNEAPEAFAARRVDAMAGLVFSGDGTVFHRSLADKIIDGVKPSLDDVEKISPSLYPRSVAGRELEAYIGPNIMNRITQWGFTKVIDPIINNLSRQPLFFLSVKEEMKSLKHAIDNKMLDFDQALRIAMTRATHVMLPQIHNTALRTQFGILVRNYLPFYFAQEQAMRRAANLIMDNPNAFRQYQLVEQGINNPAFIEEDEQGGRYLVLPVIGELGAGFLSGAAALGIPVVGGLPVTISGNMESLKTVLPELGMPGVSPLVSVAAKALSNIDPTMTRALKVIVGDRSFSNTILDTLIPSSPARSIVRAAIADDGDRMFSNAMISAIAAAHFHGQVPDPNASPMEQQKFIDRVKNNARSIFIIKALLSAVSPLSPGVSQEDMGLRDEFYKLANGMGNYPEALQEFLWRHGDSAISYTVARSEGTIPGAYLPYTNEAMNWIEENQDLISSQYAQGAAFLIPQTEGDGDVQAIHDELIKMRLRSRRTPEAFHAAVYVATGNNAVAQARAAHKEALNKLAGDGMASEQENKNYSAWLNDFGKLNPVWWNDYKARDKENMAIIAVDNLNQIFAKGLAPKHKQSDLVAGLLAEYNKHIAALAYLRQQAYNDGSITVEKENWQTYLDQRKAAEPRLATIINGVFSRLD